MKRSAHWFHPVSLPEIDPPPTKIIGGNLYEVWAGKLELARYLGRDEAFSVPECSTPVVAISTGAFSNAACLRSVTLPGSVRTVGDYAFYQCRQLTEVCISSGLQHIGACAFAGCGSLESIYIPPTVEQIGENAFRGCSNLVIQGKEDSAIHRYADEHDLLFITADGHSAA